MSNGKMLDDLKNMVNNGEELSIKQYRTFMLSVAMEAKEERKCAAKERKEIKRMVYKKHDELKKKIEDLPDQREPSELAKDNKEEVDRIRDEEIPALRSSSRISDGILGFLALIGAYLASVAKQ